MATFNLFMMLLVVMLFLPNTIGILISVAPPAEKLLDKKNETPRAYARGFRAKVREQASLARCPLGLVVQRNYE